MNGTCRQWRPIIRWRIEQRKHRPVNRKQGYRGSTIRDEVKPQDNEINKKRDGHSPRAPDIPSWQDTAEGHQCNTGGDPHNGQHGNQHNRLLLNKKKRICVSEGTSTGAPRNSAWSLGRGAWSLGLLHFVPDGVHFGKGAILERLALGLHRGLDGAETARELGGGGLEGALRIDLQEAGVVRDGEEHVAELLLHVVGGITVLHGFLELVQFLADLRDGTGGILPVEPDTRGLLGGALGLEERGKDGGDAVDRGMALLLLVLLLFDLLPVLEDSGGILGNDVAEDMRMTADELVGDGVRHVVEGELVRLLGHDGLENDLEEDVAELLDVVLLVGGMAHRVEELVGLLEDAGLEGLKRLDAVPWAAIRGAEALHDGVKTGD